jgi:cell division protein FtsZ
MIHFDLPKEKSSILKVIGVGGGGSNAVNYMYSQNIEGVDFIICNTDAQSIAQSLVPNRVQLGPHLTQGLGAGANPEIGKQATEESLEEIRRMLEVNTKMAFITAGMGGGTGTGGAPIIAKICRDLGILTVGIVTTPFSYEGKKRQLQAEEGIDILKQYVDTLLVISNDKLRHQFGNLKMKEAFSRADNVLATAAKCITDVINSTGQINVDFADVCTVMRKGGVAILGSAAVAGENRAQKAIEDALNSPLLNDNDIRGAKWILININAAEGEHEFTMDEVEIIQNYLLSRAGETTDVILGMGYDNTLGEKIGITLIATGFEHKDPFARPQEPVVEEKKEEKIVMTLSMDAEEKKTYNQAALSFDTKVEEQPVPVAVIPQPEPVPVADQFAPTLQEDVPPVRDMMTLIFEDEQPREEAVEKFVLLNEETDLSSTFKPHESPAGTDKTEIHFNENKEAKDAVVATSASGGYLAKPSNIYAQTTVEESTPVLPVHEPELTTVARDEDIHFEMQLVIKDEKIPAADVAAVQQTQTIEEKSSVEDLPSADEADDQKRRAAERLHKLRNLSFNINAADPNNEFETVPAYIRRNMELYNTNSFVEDFYTNYTVKSDDNNQGQISTINTFLDGQKPD